MALYCIRCGLSEPVFLETGKFGCPSCFSCFLPKDWTRFYSQNREISVPVKIDHSPYPHISLFREVTCRIRLTRCLRDGFFPYYSPANDKIISLLEEKGIPLDLKTSSSVVSPDYPYRFYWKEEDHLRLEWIFTWEKGSILSDEDGFSPFSKNFFKKIKGSKKKVREILFRKGLWAWSTRTGFLNSCPTNAGRGDRLSLQWKMPMFLYNDLEAYLSLILGFGLEFRLITDDKRGRKGEDSEVQVQFSCKNANPIQKLRFHKILGLLGFA
ncbi:hypothetical protein [Leptospira ilyithenensis]|uniref:Phosphagen kinase C-terminal domain-containing protein n=1 Tax=Leptospira ilyithenensis TaxID=2484901 RepID=A0A4R9LNT5_9LEPT|nr:hypothetical protein [Leptospira ilyithenensis]TGN07142.1 hypothetical protein EHS11_18705 [Leptospira ilyithenensis]